MIIIQNKAMNRLFKIFLLLLIISVSNSLKTNAFDIIWDIGDGSLIIPGNSTDNYILTGSSNVNNVIVETGYRGVITLRNLNITLDISALRNALWVEHDKKMNELKQQDDYKEKFGILTQERQVLEDNLVNHIKWNRFQECIQELEFLRKQQQDLYQKQEFIEKQQKVNELWQELYNTTLGKEYQSKQEELNSLWQKEDYPGRQQDIEKLQNEIWDIENKMWDLPVGKEIIKIQQELLDMEQVLNNDIGKLENERSQLEYEIYQEIWQKDSEIYDLVKWLWDETSAKEQELNLILENSPISVRGQDNLSNMTPITNVDIILEGTNVLSYTGYYGYPAFHVEQGAQINIMAIDPSDNNSGTLSATVSNVNGGAGIGALNYEPYGYRFENIVYREATAISPILGNCYSLPTAGGNVVISSGKVTAKGGHGAGIGGGWGSYYDGMIVIYGGEVDASSIKHAAGMGSGCPTGVGVVEYCYTPNSAIIVLPPAKISAAGSGDTEFFRMTELALAGSNVIVYIGDPAKPVNTVHTVDFGPFANIYVDLSESPSIKKVIEATISSERLDINKIYFGQTGSDALYRVNGVLNDEITFFTDAVSSKTFGRPYIPIKVAQLPQPDNASIILNLLETELSLEAVPSNSLCENYTSAQALTNAFRVKITYSDEFQMENLIFEIVDGADFEESAIRFYASDGITQIATPTTLKEGDEIYAAIPLQTGRAKDEYMDVFRFSGTWNGYPTGYLRQIISQTVGALDISASPNPIEGGVTSGSDIYSCGDNVTLTATPNYGYNFINWTRGNQIISTNTNYSFTATSGLSVVANFALKTYDIIVSANPSYGGTASGGGHCTHGDEISLTATPSSNYKFVNWTENDVVVSNDANYQFTANDNRTLVANFREYYFVDVDVNVPEYGNSTGSDEYTKNTFASVEAFVNSCYRFANWTVNGVVVSEDNPYSFEVIESLTVVANFYALDFDTYSPTLWNNTFMLNLNKLDEDGYDITGCKWFKNGMEETNTRTIDEYSYSAGSDASDKLEPEPAFYMFQIITNNFGALCSTFKTIKYDNTAGKSNTEICAYPNPLRAGSQLTIEGVVKGGMINIYNQTGVLVGSVISVDSVVTLTLPERNGVYMIHCGEKVIKIVITN